MERYNKHPKHFVAVDCVILGYDEGELCLLLYPRGFQPSKGAWSLMGGFVQNNESSDDAAKRVLKQTIGLEDIFMKQVGTFAEPDRDTEDRVISIAYYALVRIEEHDKACVREHGAHWWPISELPAMIFDHRKMVDKALLKLQQEAGYRIIGQELLAEKFTMLQLRQLYQAIFQREFDPGNFRKKILSLDVLERLNEKNMLESKKGAFYYKCKEENNERGLDRIVKV
ncbi:ADP-ribose pyrophosphatase YjhB, NUDIX family [Mariniphaga anaerophila]|uniref:ADP-ribose pyrophosphatase YjhB, NUDIX family n=1 Tax=Mariniphaga anaerophila TaxID=1484053 RepID=A0A1M4U4P2_9BACT|nr:NUDIX domain-containing protein [Mariniphaga anaerophila]SHE51708.1 ADP-ribose pyrophosphatase YjhB, NUDIX family [Mariniphaga anaerophila]